MELERLVGQTIAHYHILALLRREETGTIFLAQDVHLRRQVDLLVYRLTEDQRSAFVQRARLLAELDHPNLLPVYDYREQPDFVYMVCPHQDGESLAVLLAKQQPLIIEQVLHITEQFFQAILALDEQGLIRRPVPLADLSLRPDGTLVINLVSVMGIVLPDMTETPAHSPTSFLRQGENSCGNSSRRALRRT
jgi:serine/threonine protein kinase